MRANPSTARTRSLRALRAGRLTALGAAVAFAQGCATDSDTVAQGRALYEANCVACHGEGALGDGPMASGLPVPPPNLFEHLGHHTQAHLIQLIQTGVPPAMPPTALSEDEIRLVVDYVWSLVPESEVAELRAMQQQMEMMGDSAMESMPGMQEMDHSEHMPGAMPGMQEMDHSQHMPNADSGSMPMETTQ